MDNLDQEGEGQGQGPASQPSSAGASQPATTPAPTPTSQAATPAEEPVVPRFKIAKPKVYSPDAQGTIREEGTGARDFNAR